MSPSPLSSGHSSMQLRIATSCPSPGVVRVAVTGEIDLATADMLYAALSGVVFAQLSRRIEIDFAGVTFMDCTGISVLILVRSAAARVGCQLRIYNLRPILAQILELTGMLGVLTGGSARAPLVPALSAAVAQTGRAPSTVTQPSGRLAATGLRPAS